MAETIVGIIRDECALDPGIKLPNDILIGAKKVCGILTEKTKDALIIGVGLNLNIKKFPADLNAASLALECGRTFDGKYFFNKIIEGFRIAYSKFLFNKV